MGKISFYEVAQVLIEHNGLEANVANEFVKTMFDIIQERLTIDQQVKVKGLGTFKIIDVEARESINVNTGERILIEGHSKISFSPDATMKELINKPFSQFETVILNDGVNFDDAKPEVNTEVEKADISVPVMEEIPVVAESPIIEDKVSEKEQQTVTEEEPAIVADEVETPAVVGEKDTPAMIDEDETPAMVDEDETPAMVDEDETPAVADEKETPAVADEDETSAVTDEKETPAVTDEKETPAVVDEDETPAVVDEKKTHAVVEKEKPAVAEEPEVDGEPESRLPSHFKPVFIHLIYITVVAVLAGWGGYWYGKSSAEKELAASNAAVQAPRRVVKKVVVTKKVSKSDTVRKDTVKNVPQVKKEEVKVVENASSADDFAKYAKMDSRVRTGAYVIVGEKGTEKVRKGETVARISRRLLGDGMECYIEVFNGITADTQLKEGQEIKIPKLKLKKSVQRKKGKNS